MILNDYEDGRTSIVSHGCAFLSVWMPKTGLFHLLPHLNSCRYNVLIRALGLIFLLCSYEEPFTTGESLLVGWK